jgi:hypothetical protein
VDVKVVRARVIDGEWRAVRIEGTWSYTNVAQLGCRSAGSTYDVDGTSID